ncbi:MAG: hypothetical protein NTY88_06500 [Bacteroidetes bacterium]|nr:hypothetical protein [Bacteroidota bacterium]
MKVHIGEKIRKRAEELKTGTTELGRIINTSKQNVYGIFKRASIDTQLLLEVSKALRFNFFQFYDSPELAKFESKINKELETLRRENEKLKSELRALKEKNELLQKINKLLDRKEKSEKRKTATQRKK